MQRYHIDSKDKLRFIEFIHDEQGLVDAQVIRKLNMNYRYQRIKEVLQLYPFDVLPGVEYLRK